MFIRCAILVVLSTQWLQSAQSLRKIMRGKSLSDFDDVAAGFLEINASYAEIAQRPPPAEACTSRHPWSHVSTFVRGLGTGAFGRVCQVQFKSESPQAQAGEGGTSAQASKAYPCEQKWPVALKVQDLGPHMTHQKALGEIMIQQLASKTSGLTVAVYQSFTWKSPARNFAMIELAGGDLQAMLNRFRGGMAYVDGGKLVRLIFAQLVLAVKQLHDVNIVHSDLKPGNIMINTAHCIGVNTAQEWVSKNCAVKIADYGVSCMSVVPKDMRGVLSCSGVAGTPVYLPPEVGHGFGNIMAALGLGSRRRSKSFDIWALGAMLYEMLFGKPMFYKAGGVDAVGLHLTPLAVQCQGAGDMPFKEQYEEACELMIATDGMFSTRATAKQLWEETNYVTYGAKQAERIEQLQSRYMGHGTGATAECIKFPNKFS